MAMPFRVRGFVPLALKQSLLSHISLSLSPNYANNCTCLSKGFKTLEHTYAALQNLVCLSGTSESCICTIMLLLLLFSLLLALVLMVIFML